MYFLDFARSYVLRRTLKIKFLRDCYRSKIKRTYLLFCVSLLVNGFLILNYPLVSFYLIPLLLGVPHIYSSIRYGYKSSNQTPYYILWILIFVAQVLQRQRWVSDPHGLLNGFAVLCTLFIIKINFRETKNKLILFIPLVITLGFIWNAFIAALVIMLAHNFFAFIFWYYSSKSIEEKRMVVIAFAFTLATAIILYFVPVSTQLGELAQNLTGLYETRITLWLTSAFLFTQSIHYFIWLKAIPDFTLQTDTPLSFRNGDKKIRDFFGNRIYFYIGSLIIVLTVFSFYVGLEEGRQLYIQLSAFHGLAEIGFIAAMLKKGSA